MQWKNNVKSRLASEKAEGHTIRELQYHVRGNGEGREWRRFTFAFLTIASFFLILSQHGTH